MRGTRKFACRVVLGTRSLQGNVFAEHVLSSDVRTSTSYRDYQEAEIDASERP